MRAEILCDDHQELLAFERSIWANNDELLGFAIMDSYIGNRTYQGLAGRFRRAWRAFLAKPIYYADIAVTDPESIKIFLEECLTILSCNAEDQKEYHVKQHGS